MTSGEIVKYRLTVPYSWDNRSSFEANLDKAISDMRIISYVIVYWPEKDNAYTDDFPVINVSLDKYSIRSGESVKEMFYRILWWSVTGDQLHELEELAESLK